MNLLSSLRRLDRPVLIIVMGVSGCGKSTLAQQLADQYELCFVEADDFHSEQNKQKMAAGIALTDADRQPWIEHMCDFLQEKAEQHQHCVLAYSGLRKAHREAFRQLPFATIFLFLHGAADVILPRMQQRNGHFMPSALLESQYQSLQQPDNEGDVKQIDIALSPKQILLSAEQIVLRWLSRLLAA